MPVAQTTNTEGYYLCRDNIPTPEYPGFQNKYIIEERVSIAITTSLRLATPCYTLVTLTDCPEVLDGTVDGDYLQQSQLADLCGELTGVTVFQSIIYQIIEKWAQFWMSVLNHFSLKISRLPNTQLSNNTILSSWSRRIEEM
ncbi:hypothetical protein CGRA01v4_02135 [Colletotrichum graminicola]|nr:hypothetical protein CGRA01v4_02135 [Colletotrichum graminicola]